MEIISSVLIILAIISFFYLTVYVETKLEKVLLGIVPINIMIQIILLWKEMYVPILLVDIFGLFVFIGFIVVFYQRKPLKKLEFGAISLVMLELVLGIIASILRVIF